MGSINNYNNTAIKKALNYQKLQIQRKRNKLPIYYIMIIHIFKEMLNQSLYKNQECMNLFKKKIDL